MDKPTATLILKCTGERVNAEDVTFLDIEEDFQGYDLMTFKCPGCGEVHKSHIFG